MSSSLQLNVVTKPTTRTSKVFNDLIDRTFRALGRETEAESSKHDVWRTGSAKQEALAVYAMLGKNGDSIESLRQLIAVSPIEKAELEEWAACSSPAIALGIEHMISYRRQVLLQFDRLVENARGGDFAAAISDCTV